MAFLSNFHVLIFLWYISTFAKRRNRVSLSNLPQSSYSSLYNSKPIYLLKNQVSFIETSYTNKIWLGERPLALPGPFTSVSSFFVVFKDTGEYVQYHFASFLYNLVSRITIVIQTYKKKLNETSTGF